VRVRLPWLRRDRDRCTAIADRLATLRGVRKVEVRPSSGSVLCTFDVGHTRSERILAAVRRETGVAIIRAGGAARAVPRSRRRRGPARVGRAVTAAVRALDDEVWDATNGNLDLGTVAGLLFLGAGAAEVMATRRFALPSWFNLAWWAFRTFALYEAGDADES
jgi:hypothetical protein